MSAHDAAPVEVVNLELEVLEEVWRQDPDGTTVRAVLEAINAREDRPRAYTTVMTVLARLHDKGLLERHRHRNRNLYRARFTREQYASERARAEIDRLVGAYGDVALAGFVRRVAEEEPRRRAQLRRLARRD